MLPGMSRTPRAYDSAGTSNDGEYTESPDRNRFRGSVMLSNTGHGFGTLEIRPDTLRLELSPVTAAFLGAITGTVRALNHHGTRVEVFCAWMWPGLMPWRNTGVVIRGHGLSGVIVVAAWHRRRLLAQLDGAGFDVARRDTLVGVGYGALRRRR